MDKINDTLTFTDAVSQGSERTPQQAMAEEATKKLAERTKRAEEQVKLERRLAALKAEPPEQRRNSLEPLVPNMTLATCEARGDSRSRSGCARRRCAGRSARSARHGAAPAAHARPRSNSQQRGAGNVAGEAAKLLRSAERAVRERSPRSPRRRQSPRSRRFATSRPTKANRDLRLQRREAVRRRGRAERRPPAGAEGHRGGGKVGEACRRRGMRRAKSPRETRRKSR